MEGIKGHLLADILLESPDWENEEWEKKKRMKGKDHQGVMILERKI